MAIKLIKACKELNLGMTTIMSWLERNGHIVEADPNIRLDDEIFLALVRHFAPAFESKLFEDGVYIPQQLSITKEQEDFVLNDLCLANGEIVGRYVEDERCYIDDLRNPSFSKLVDKDNLRRKLKVFVDKCNFRGLKNNQYYRFKCRVKNVNPLLFELDDSYTPILLSPKDIVQLLYCQNCPNDYNARKRTCQQLKMLETQLSGSGPDIFIYELLQNANDYPIEDIVDGKRVARPVDVEFHLTKNYLVFEHTGEYFSPSNIAALCDFNAEEKAENKEAIGYKGIGFKTIFHSSNYVYLHTGKFSFSYDEQKAKNGTFIPWQIIPNWIDESAINPDIQKVLTSSGSEKFRVQFAICPREKGLLNDVSLPHNYISLFKEVFKTERVILFIKNIHQVSIFFEGNSEETLVQSKDTDKWLVYDADITENNISKEITDNINLALTTSEDELSTDEIRKRQQLLMQGYDRIPPKYKNFTKTSVKFACQREGRNLLPVDDKDPHIYCYLPARKVDWGFPFLMNTDMIPTGDRGDIENIEVNHEIAKIAGRQFFAWIKSVLLDDNIEPSSVFDLIPNFKECIDQKTHYSKFIEEFKVEFEQLIKSTPFVPCVDAAGNKEYVTINSIIDDLTGISAAGFMSDADFIHLSNMGTKYLPIKELRSSESFKDFLYRYSPQNYDFDFSKLKSKVSTAAFKEWLEIEENDAHFICHLLDNDKLNDFAKEEIFLEATDGLYCSEGIYQDYDADMGRIPFFKDYIPYLSPTLYQVVKTHEKWEDYAEAHFKKFEAADMLKCFILEKDEAIAQLSLKENSIAFFTFIAEKDIDIELIKNKVPFFDEFGFLQTEYNKAYFYSDNANAVYGATWLPEDSFYLLSQDYFENNELGEKLKAKFVDAGVRVFSDDEFIQEKLVCVVDFAALVNEKITDHLQENLDFVKYLFEHRKDLCENQLKDYTLLCLDKEENEVYLNKDDVRYFSHFTEPGNSSYEDNISYEWIDKDMMYSLSASYLNLVELEQKKAMESFLRQCFGVKTFTDKSFWTDVVYANRSDIYEKINSRETALSFLEYLCRNNKVLFDGSISFNEIKDFPLLRNDGSVSSDRDYPLYAYDEVAADLEKKEWYTTAYYLLDPAYSERLSSEARQLLQIELFDLQKVVDALCEYLTKYYRFDNTEQCIDFWRWVKANAKKITNYDLLQDVPILKDSYGYWPCKGLYIPDAYFPAGEGVENLVRKFNNDAQFIPVDLIESDSETCKAEWLRLLKKLGTKADNQDILLDVLENIKEYEEDTILDSVLALFTQSKKILFEKWDEYLPSLKQLRVRTRKNGYLTLDECIIIELNEPDAEAEPFRYIELGNEIAPELLKANKEIVLKIAESFEGDNILKDRKEWARYKIDEYINRIQNDELVRSEIHITFVRDLAKWGDNYNLDREQISKIQFRCKASGVFMDAAELTLGTRFKPICDFEQHEVKLNYLSDSYITDDNLDIIRAFFKYNTDVHNSFEVEDIQYMSNRDFAIYIWTNRLAGSPSSFSQWIEDGEFDNVQCIPTATGVKCPNELYAPHLMEYVRLCDNYKEKIPAIDYSKLGDGQSVFSKLPFKTSLSSEDCLSYLLREREKDDEDAKHRRQIIEWLLENEDLTDEEVAKYRSNPEAKWKNGKLQYVHIGDLYAIHPLSSQERAVFSSDEHVLRTRSFPAKDNVEGFERICEMLDIQVLRSTDFTPDPIAPVILQTSSILEKLKVRLLILAAIGHGEKYSKYYEQYIDIIKSYNFYACAQIELRYEDLHATAGRIYVDKGNKKIYYVSAWDNQRTYTKFCRTIKDLLDIKSDQVDDETCEEVFDESMSVEKLVDKYCYSLRSNKDFLQYMESQKLRVLAITEEIPEVKIEEIDYVSYKDEASEQEEEPMKRTPSFIEEEPYDEVEDGVIDDFAPTTETHTIREQSPIRATERKAPEHVENPRVQPQQVQEAHEGTYSNSDAPAEENPISATPRRPHYPAEPSERRASRTSHTPREPWTPDPDAIKSTGIPVELATLEMGAAEEADLRNILNGMSSDAVANQAYLANYRLFKQIENWKQEHPEYGLELEESMEEFVRNIPKKDGVISDHQLKSGKFIRACSAAGGVLYLSPGIWNMVADGRCMLCVYRGADNNRVANQFLLIKSYEELLQFIGHDDLIVKITGEHRVKILEFLYNNLNSKVTRGKVYSLIRVAESTSIDSVAAPVSTAMSEQEDDDAQKFF